MECTFKVGQKVVCVNADWIGDSPLVLNKVYTVTDVRPYYKGKSLLGNRPSIVISVYETSNPSPAAKHFDSRRFRPLVEDKEEDSEAIKLFRRIADGVTKGQPVVDDPVFNKRLTKEHRS